VGAQVTVTGQNFGSTQGSSAVLLHGLATTVNLWSSTSITITIPTGATSGYLTVSVAPSMNDSNAINFTVEANALPQSWLDQDVGRVYIAGNASYSNGVFSVKGGGNYTDSNIDGFHFAYQSLTGDGTIIARVATTGYAYAMAGVMMSASLMGGDQNVFLCEYAGGTRTFYRPTFGTAESYVSSGGGVPYWVKLVRTGNNFIAYTSADGASWTLVAGPIPIPMPQTIYVGLAETSNGQAFAYTGTFDNVSISTTANAAPVISSVSATTASVGTQVVITGSGFGSTQGASIVTFNELPASVSIWSDTSIIVTVPSGATSGYLNVLRGPDMASSNGVFFTVESQPLLSGWFDTDIGKVSARGSASYSNGVFTVQGSGGEQHHGPGADMHGRLRGHAHGFAGECHKLQFFPRWRPMVVHGRPGFGMFELHHSRHSAPSIR
jgi:IPT/TIG domain